MWRTFLMVSVLSGLFSADETSCLVTFGPWVLVGENGRIEIGAEVCAPGDGNPVSFILKSEKTTITSTVTRRPIQRAQQSPSVVVSMLIDGMNAIPGTYSLTIDKKIFPVIIPARPSPTTAVRVAIAGARNWPSSADIQRLATTLGGTISVVVAVGDGVADALGHGGWEASIPVLPLINSSSPSAQNSINRALEEAVFARVASWWPMGATWGALGLPAGTNEVQARSAMAQDLSPWLVYLADESPWNLDLSAPASFSSAHNMVPIMGLCQRFSAPIVLITNGNSGWISEPLGVEKGILEVRSGGTRCIGAVPAGNPLHSLPDEVALAIEQPSIIGLCASVDEFVVAIQGFAADIPVQRMRYAATNTERIRRGTGWGSADPEEARAVWSAGGEHAAAALEDLSWMSMSSFERLHLSNEDVTRLSSTAATDPAALRLARRLLVKDPVLVNQLSPIINQLPPVVTWDLVLRQIAKPRLIDSNVWSASVTEGTNLTLLRSVLAAGERGDETMLRLLMQRLRRQGNGTLPLEIDPMFQHRIICAVYDSGRMSPTPLREIALILRERVGTLGRGPLDRFLARYGEKRQPLR